MIIHIDRRRVSKLKFTANLIIVLDTLYAYALQPGSDSQDSHFFIGAVYYGFGVLRSDQRPMADDPCKSRHEELAVSSIVRILAPVRYHNRNQ